MYIFIVLLCITNIFYATEQDNEIHQQQKEIPVVQGDIFIIPDRLRRPKEGCCNSYWSKYYLLDSQNNPIKIDDDNYCVEVWATDTNAQDYYHLELKEIHALGISINWTDHGHPILKHTFPRALPLSLLKDKKEGDIIEFEYKSEITQGIYKVILTCRQEPYRYGDFGSFEQVLTDLQESKKLEKNNR
ncbi:MAG TPA: hypothetical protein VGW78_07240 [Candidatus Babeliales bacterium]|jgi:hypothetical protein|nr:hypothetical protein [Candidatus Babeliales bacterium]